MTTAGDNITKANITASMEALRSFNSGIVWHTDNNPFTPSITNNYGAAGVSPLGGDASGYANGGMAGDISDTNVTASTITTNFRVYATLLSRIRNVRLLKWFQIQGDIRAQLDYDTTNITNLGDNWKADMSTITGPASGNIVDASDLDDFVSALSTAINNNRTNLLTFEEYYCHSNCHGSCHGSI